MTDAIEVPSEDRKPPLWYFGYLAGWSMRMFASRWPSGDPRTEAMRDGWATGYKDRAAGPIRKPSEVKPI